MWTLLVFGHCDNCVGKRDNYVGKTENYVGKTEKIMWANREGSKRFIKCLEKHELGILQLCRGNR